MNKTATVTPEKMQRLAEEIGDVREVIDLVTDLINFIPNVKSEQVQSNPLFYYGEVKESLNNVFHANQGLTKRLDDIAGELYDLQEELKNEVE